ncbi:acyl-CoA carboxylase subunit epsilon [Nocardioides aurantiacus]|uniref:Acyl-CoA carboxylase epsilon subunit-like protein n=1 Tax=Nocardioides aurantiacus TaxID=86796 RepID=A0A3N2CS77_9ACTN|nr:acyl-CoA carboxylase subunit epsilon [Nocardioides aurantiacus]ROR90218.1 acyl-CoA carboxylase epsilon subunit-like protein [Nocardioides aurantiacus]
MSGSEPSPSVEPTSGSPASVEPGPLLRVVTGDPSPEELAALVAVVAAAGSGGAPDSPAPRSEWSARHRLVRGPHRHGPGAWRASAR